MCMCVCVYVCVCVYMCPFSNFFFLGEKRRWGMIELVFFYEISVFTTEK